MRLRVTSRCSEFPVYKRISSYAPQGVDIIWFRLCQITDHHLRLDWHSPKSETCTIALPCILQGSSVSCELIRHRSVCQSTFIYYGHGGVEYINIIIRQSHANCLSARQECAGNRETAFGYCFPIDLLHKPSCHPSDDEDQGRITGLRCQFGVVIGCHNERCSFFFTGNSLRVCNWGSRVSGMNVLNIAPPPGCLSWRRRRQLWLKMIERILAHCPPSFE